MYLFGINGLSPHFPSLGFGPSDPEAAPLVDEAGGLTLRSVASSSSGSYRCTASNGVGEDIAKSVSLVVNSKFICQHKNQSWALSVFLNFFNRKNDFIASFIKLITYFCKLYILINY